MANNEKNPYRLGLALSGGGARGFAHLGILKALEEHNIRPDVISGTSVGSLVAVFYAAGYSIDEILDVASSLKFSSIAEGIIPRGGLFKTTGIKNLLKKHIKAQTFEELSIPIRIVASDIEFGRVKVFKKGEIIPAVLASCSVPAVFTPVEIDGHYYVDGGLLMNFPASVIRNECRILMGVDISPVITMKYEDSIKYVIERAMNYMVGANTASQRDLCDYLIESFQVSEYSIFDFKQNHDIYKMGYKLACDHLNHNKEKLEKDLRAAKSSQFRNQLADLVLKLKSQK